MKHNIVLSALLSLCAVSLLSMAASAQEAGWLQRDTVVNTQFGKVEAWRNASSVSVAKPDKLEKSFTQNVLNTLYGEIPGLIVQSGSGEPGSDSPSLLVRGVNTPNGRGILIMVDGYESTLDNICVEEIETVEVLKDAAATAIYGMRGANGVILVTTKRGHDGPLRVKFSAQTGFNTPYKTPQFLDAVDYANLYNEARANDGLSPYYSEEAIAAYANGTDKYLYPNVDWAAQILNKVSLAQNYNLSFTGGGKTVRYYALLGVSDNNGFFAQTDPKRHLSANSKFMRYNIRSNVDVNISDRLSAHLNLAANVADNYSPNGGAWGVYNRLAQITPNAFPVYNPDGSYGGNATFSNPVGDIIEKGYNSSNSRNVQTDLAVKYEFGGFAQGLSLTGEFSFRNWFSGSYNKSRTYRYYDVAVAGDEYVYNGYSEDTDMSINDSGASQWRYTSYTFKFDYDRIFGGKHAVAANLHFFSDLNYTNGDTSVKDYQFPYKWMGFRGRLSYAYDKRYVAEFTFNEMGSDLYAKGHKWGFFPAGSLGWIISNEDFLKDSEVVNHLKLRGSFGSTGSAIVVGSTRYAYTQNYKYTESYYKGVNNTQQYTKMEDSVADPNRTWERELKGNVGLEATLWNSLGITVDAFYNKRDQILVSPTGEVPSVLGMSFAYLNLGKSTNRGVDVTLSWDRNLGDFGYYARANFSLAKNRIDYMAEELRLYDYQVRTGGVYDQGFGLVSEGLFRDQAEIDNAPVHTFSNVKPGDIRYKDLNDDGVIDADDTKAIGFTGVPEYYGSLVLGLRFKGFDFETMVYGVGNRTSYLSGNTYWAFMNQYSAPASALARWTPETAATAIYPRLSTQANANNTQYSDFWQVNGSFLKLRYVELGYSLPERAAQALRAQSFRLFVNGTNLIGLNAMGGRANADPEGVSGFPQMRTVSLGVKVQF